MPEAGTQLTRQNQELTIFHDVAKALTSSLDLDSILQTIMEKMAEYFRPDTWSLLMVDEGHDELYFAIAVGDKAEALEECPAERWAKALPDGSRNTARRALCPM